MHQLLFCFTEVYQFRVELDISKGLNMTIEEVHRITSLIMVTVNCSLHTQLILKTVGTTTETVTVYSMRTLSTTSCVCMHTDIWTSSHPNRTASLLVTLQSVAGSASIVRALSTWFSSVASSTTVEPLQIVRYGASEASCQYQIPDYMFTFWLVLRLPYCYYYSNIIQFMFTAFFSLLYISDGCPEETLRLLSSSLPFCWRHLVHILMARD